jgi:hypothetical protein
VTRVEALQPAEMPPHREAAYHLAGSRQHAGCQRRRRHVQKLHLAAGGARSQAQAAAALRHSQARVPLEPPTNRKEYNGRPCHDMDKESNPTCRTSHQQEMTPTPLARLSSSSTQHACWQPAGRGRGHRLWSQRLTARGPAWRRAADSCHQPAPRRRHAAGWAASPACAAAAADCLRFNVLGVSSWSVHIDNAEAL